MEKLEKDTLEEQIENIQNRGEEAKNKLLKILENADKEDKMEQLVQEKIDPEDEAWGEETKKELAESLSAIMKDERIRIGVYDLADPNSSFYLIGKIQPMCFIHDFINLLLTAEEVNDIRRAELLTVDHNAEQALDKYPL